MIKGLLFFSPGGAVRLGGPQLQGTFDAGEDDRRSQGTSEARLQFY
ncbi:MAG TPA: hypothetical protein VGH65_03065 [Verrucomicrobiaceae bacterium]|jgi:hypothetical protein